MTTREKLTNALNATEDYIRELDRQLWTIDRQSNPQGYADREREIDAANERYEMLRGELAELNS